MASEVNETLPPNDDLEFWMEFLDVNFGHRDYLILNHKWKIVRMRSVAGQIVDAIRMVKQHGDV